MADDPDEEFFEQVYAQAGEDLRKVPWAGLVARPSLVEWLDSIEETGPRRALVIGCGLGDDAEEVARRGHEVMAFDFSATAIDRCHKRFPDSAVRYQVADLFALPPEWRHHYDVVVEVNTIQSLPPMRHRAAIVAISATVAPAGELFLWCSGREDDEPTVDRPWPLSREELSAFGDHGLIEVEHRDLVTEAGVRIFQNIYERPVPKA